MHLVASNVGMVLLLKFPVSPLDLLGCGINCDPKNLVVVLRPSPRCAAAPDHTSLSIIVLSIQFMMN